MRCSIIFFVFQFCCIFSFGQNNLIPNGSFEDLSDCPTTVLGSDYYIRYAIPWWNASYSIGSSPDLINLCMNEALINHFENAVGPQNPLDGYGYVGVYAYMEPPSNGSPNEIAFWGEYVECELTEQILPSHNYIFKINLSLAENISNHNLKKLTIAISNDSIIGQNLFLGSNIIENTFPDYEEYEFFEITGLDSVPYDGWQEFEIVITPTQIARHIAIGTFKSNYQIFEENEPVFSHYAAAFRPQTYYFIDEVSLVEVIDTTSLEDVHKTNVKISPNPFNNFLTVSGLTDGEYIIKLFDMSSRLIYETKFKGGNAIQVSTEHIQNGAYFLEVSSINGNRIITEKIIK